MIMSRTRLATSSCKVRRAIGTHGVSLSDDLWFQHSCH